MATETNPTLCIGDYITLQSVHFDALLGAEGILLSDLVVTESKNKDFNDCIFQIHSNRTYSASRELENFLETNNVEDMKSLDDSTKQHLKALTRGRDNEVKLNDNNQQRVTGKPICFGTVIQLFHLKSRKYLVVNRKDLAHSERENSRVLLDSSGNIHSWMQFMPRYKRDREGDELLTDSEVFIRLSEHHNEFIHCAMRNPKEGFKREVNCSLESTSWKCSIVQNHETIAQDALIIPGQLIYLHDPAEPRSNVTIASREVPSLNADEEAAFLAEQDEYVHEYGDIVLQPMQEDWVDSRSVWQVESTHFPKGDLLGVKSHFRLKNVSTGLYLAHKTHPEDPSSLIFTTSEDNGPETRFYLFEPNSGTAKYASKGKALQIGAGKHWLCGGGHVGSNICLRSTTDKSQALSLLILEYVEPTMDPEGMEPMDIYSCLSIRHYFRKYLDMIVLPPPGPNNSVTTLWPTSERTDFSFFQMLIMRTKQFAQGFKISDPSIVLGVDKSDQIVRMKRQVLVREAGILELAMRFVNRLKPITDLHDRNVAKKNSLSDADMAVMKFGSLLLTQALDVVYYCVLDNSDNQMFVADFLPDLLAHLSSQPLAGKCVTAMLSSNMELQETKITKREITIFVEKLRVSKMNSMYLNLLQACCSCQGNGVDGNQCKVAETLFEDTNDVIISMIVDYNKVVPRDWGESIYIPPAIVSGAAMEGQTLLDKGLPDISLAWTTNIIDLSPLGLFGKLSVNVQDLYDAGKKSDKLDLSGMSAEKAAMIKKQKAKAAASQAQKDNVADYFINELYLGAEMCMDRNYVSMYKLDDYFSYESLVTIMKMNVHNRLKAAACRMLFCLHVDREPQVAKKVPCLTRTWTVISKYDVPQLPSVDSDRVNAYALIQQLCSQHVTGMTGRKWDKYSMYILEMMLGLLKFNFYGTIEKLSDVLVPIISAVDRRKVDYSDGASNRGRHSGNDDEDEEEDEQLAALLLEKERRMNSWQKKHFDLLESLPAMVGILFLVLAAVVVTIYLVIANAEETLGFKIFGYIVLVVFLYDFFMRYYCYWYVYREHTKFLCSTFNIIDQVVILIDVAFLVLDFFGGVGGSATNFTKTLRLVRLVRLIRVLRAAKVINALTQVVEDEIEWLQPLRYAKIPMDELETMTLAIDILMYIQGVIEDRNLSLFMRAFYAWESGSDQRSPEEIFASVVKQTEDLRLGIQDFDEIFIDNIMFKHLPLVQGSLNILMARHSLRETLLRNAHDVQLLVSPKRERQFRTISNIVMQLERNAETHELWGELETEFDHQTNKQTKEILTELVELCRVRSTVLEFGEDYTADTSIQDLLRNLGLFEISLKVLGLMESCEEDDLNEDGTENEVSANTRHLCLLCNELLYWFTTGNAANQEQVYEELELFLESLDEGIKAHKVIRAIFKGNEALMKLVPLSLLGDMADNICQKERSHHYLALASSITHVGEKNFVKNQMEVIKSLCGPSRLEKVALWLVPVTHSSYEEKVATMQASKDLKTDDYDEMEADLAYHLNFLEVLSNCTIGRINITSVEAKVQSIYSVVDIVEAIMHPETILVVKKFLTLHLFNAIIEVEIMIPGLEKSKCIWNLLASYVAELADITRDTKTMDDSGWRSDTVTRTHIEYYLSCVMVISGFFARYYDSQAFSARDDLVGEDAKDVTDMDLERANRLMRQLYDILKPFYDYNSEYLGPVHINYVYEALEALNKCSRVPFYNHIVAVNSLLSGDGSNAADDDQEMTAEAQIEAQIHMKYAEFLEALDESEVVQDATTREGELFIEVVEEIPFLKDNSDSEIRIEPFIQKLIAHVRENMTTVNGERRLSSECTKTSVWVFKGFRTMIERKMEMTIDERDEDGGEEEDLKAESTVRALNQNGVTALCIDLLSLGIAEDLQVEAIKLLIAMLFKEGGAREIQSTMHEYLYNNDSELFFRQVKATIEKLIMWHKWNEALRIAEDEDPPFPVEIYLIRMLQLMSEGHYLPNQDLMRDQPNNLQSINLLECLVNYFNVISRIHCRCSTLAGIRVGATIVEVIQGPCAQNQEYFASTDILETSNRIFRRKINIGDASSQSKDDEDSLKDSVDENDENKEKRIRNDCVAEEEIELKKTCLDAISAMLEARTATDQVTLQILGVIHLDIVLALAKPSIDEEENTDEAVELQTECAVLLQMLCDYNPAIRKEIEEDGGLEMDPESTTSVEIQWDGNLTRRFFHVPEICALLAKSSKDNLVLTIDRENSESQLIDFMVKARRLYLEAKNQSWLTGLGIAAVFSRENKDLATWVTFYITVVINSLMVGYYDAKTEGEEPSMPDNVVLAISVLNYVQIAVASFTAILNMVTNSTVQWSYEKDQYPNITQLELYLVVITDATFLYYWGYLAVAILGTTLQDYYLALLLLDIAKKDSRLADVLQAVYGPRVKLGYSLILFLFVCYIFSFYIFRYFRYEVDHGDMPAFCTNLYDCTKFGISYGLQNGGGVADNMYHGKNDRLVLDLMWFIVVLVVFINIIFGMIIDKFSELRAAKNENIDKTNGFCFICSKDRQTFERASDVPNGFHNHIKNNHNMWSYLYFIFFLWEQDKDDDDGLEYYVRKKLETKEITWFPLNKAMGFEEMTESEAMMQDLKSTIVDTESTMTGKVDIYKKDISYLLGQLTETLRDETFNAMELNDELGENGNAEEEWNESWGYDVVVHVLEIKGIEMTKEELLTVNFRLIAEPGMYSASAKGSDDAMSAFFDQSEGFLVGEGCLTTDRRHTLEFQVLQGEGVASRFVAVVSLEVRELLAVESGSIIVKEFQRMGQVTPCNLVIQTAVTHAKFSGNALDDDLESDPD